MENTKIYNALIIIFENEEQWFRETAEIEDSIEEERRGCLDLPYWEALEKELENLDGVKQQIAFADKHWDLIEDSLEMCPWRFAYEALLELRTFFN